MTEQMQRQVRDLGNSFYIEWAELDAMVSQWAKGEIGTIAVNAMCARDETDCHIV